MKVADIRPLIYKESSRNKSHKKKRDETKFFHSEILAIGGNTIYTHTTHRNPRLLPIFCLSSKQNQTHPNLRSLQGDIPREGPTRGVGCKFGIRVSLPKGPFRTKKTTTIIKNRELLRRCVFTTPPIFTTPQTLLREENVCNSQENGVRTRCAVIANQSAIVNSLLVVNLLRIVFLVRRGPLGGAR